MFSRISGRLSQPARHAPIKMVYSRSYQVNWRHTEYLVNCGSLSPREATKTKLSIHTVRTETQHLTVYSAIKQSVVGFGGSQLYSDFSNLHRTQALLIFLRLWSYWTVTSTCARRSKCFFDLECMQGHTCIVYPKTYLEILSYEMRR